METNQKKWYQTSWAIIVFLILFFPVGLFLMWKHAKWSSKIKWIITGIFGFLVISTFASEGSKQSSQNGANSAEKPTNQAETKPSDTPKPTPDESAKNLDATVKFSDVAYQITNNEDINWIGCKLEMNSGILRGGYVYIAKVIPSKDPLIIPFREFTKGDGTRFNSYDTKPQSLSITCQMDGKLRFGHYTIN